MRILITGGAGCLGSNLIEHWLPQGHDILVLDNFATGKREVVPALPRLSLVEGSVADRVAVDRAFDSFKPSHVVHSAAAYKDPMDWGEDAATNVAGTINVADAARRHGVSRLLNFQTVLCYGRPETVPIPVDHPLRPFTSYGISKVAGEQYLAMSGLPFASLRLANVTGPRLAIGPIPTFYKRLKAGQGCFCTDAQRDFLDMSDFLAAVDLVMKADAPTGIFNVSSGEGHSIRDVYDAVRSHLKLPPDPNVKVVPVGDDDVPAVVPDPSRTKAVLGWSAQMAFPETMRRTLSWYDAHGVTDIYSHLAAAR
ncbi:NAD-dependent epimerase/dehydratase family protein [Bradyrhizobium sp. AUGA SZCCT0160]|uniref:NAD-dependent epimerase/dehydratase family protein n=1 Tax=Bradyrhizobium sp. AUGA SZCCT0160 TaxID=2807662 RepID=UPI001BA65000|nr:NAD-dependent epimerase/dehydratase family protein [Bradyrhizobium sp. AUGA SZCCT0160]MBR1190562.1 NAD-dependent epimerase/dehydratase family protein [Bradyrhizobium sp. AUGA SZCCT0160]